MAVRDQIIAAWRDAVYPGDDAICTPTYDDEGVAAYFRGRTWEGHEVRSLRYHSVGLSFFTPAAFAYYLAAYMIAVIDDAAAADVVVDSIEYHLSPAQLRRTWGDSYRARIDCLSAAQRAAVIAYLAWRSPDSARTIAYLRDGALEAPARPRVLAGKVDLSHATVTDGELAALRELEVRELDLRGTAISSAGLAEVAEVTGLVVLGLSSCRVSADGLAHLATLPHLAELELANADLDDACLHALAPLRLRRLDATHASRVTAAGWAALDVTRLEKLAIFGVDPGDALLARIGDAGRLRELTAWGVTDAGARALARTPLVELAIRAEQVTPDGLAALATIATLRELDLSAPVIEVWPSGWPALANLTLLGVELTRRGAAGLGELPALRELYLAARAIEPGALAEVARAPKLARITIRASIAVALDELAGSSVKSLSVGDARVTAAGLAALPVDTLRLQAVELDGAMLGALAVRELDLEDIAIDDAGLAILGANPRLHRLRLIRSGATPAGLAAFRATHPAIELVDL